MDQWRDVGYPSQKSSKKSANTHSQYARTMRRYLKACGDHDIDDYSWDHAKMFQDYLEDEIGLGDGTTNKEQRHLQCSSHGATMSKNETTGVSPKVSVSEKMVKVWTKERSRFIKMRLKKVVTSIFYGLFICAISM